MLITCGFCNEESTHAIELHECSDMEYFQQDLDILRSRGNGMSYSALSVAKAESFLKDYPEFIEISVTRDVNSYQRVAVGLTAEQTDWLTPTHYETLTGLPLPYEFDTEEIDREAEWDGIYANREFDGVLQGTTPWRDVEPQRCTTSVHYWKGTAEYIIGYLGDAPVGGRRKRENISSITRTPVGLMPEGWMPKGFVSHETYTQSYEALDFEKPQLMRFEFNELKGFVSELLIDADITEKFQYTVYNAYVGRDEKFHIGLLTFDRIDGRVEVTCKYKDHKGTACHYSKKPYVSPEDLTRETMETFIANCIRHGNNHGPSWIVNRKDFTYIHGSECDLAHDYRKGEPCNFNTQRTDVNRLDASDVQAVFHYLIQHRKFCRNSDCRCTHYYHLLNEVVTDNYSHAA